MRDTAYVLSILVVIVYRWALGRGDVDELED